MVQRENAMKPAPTLAMRDQRLIEGVITNLALFAGASRSQIAEVFKHCWAMSARRGDTLTQRGARLPGVFAIAYGSIKLALRGPQNEERILRLVSAGQTFGEAAALLGRPASYHALALVESKVVVIPSAALYRLIDRDSRFARGVVKALAERTLELLTEIESTAFQDGAQRLACYLDSLVQMPATPGQYTVRLPVSKTFLAARLGVKKETLSRLLRSLAEQGLIEITRREITILDRERLAEATR